MTPSEKVAFIRGLIEGLDIDVTKGEGKIFKAIVDVLEDLAYGLEDNDTSIDELNEGLDAVSEDLADVEDYLFGEDDGCSCARGCDCSCDEDEDDDFEYTIVCPACKEELLLEDEDLEAGVLQCPCCGETLELEFDEDDEESDED